MRAGVTEATVVRIQKAEVDEWCFKGETGEEQVDPAVGIVEWVIGRSCFVYTLWIPCLPYSRMVLIVSTWLHFNERGSHVPRTSY